MSTRKLTGIINQPTPPRGRHVKLIQAEPGRIVLRLRRNGDWTPAERVIETPQQFRELLFDLRSAARAAWPEDAAGWEGV